MRIALATLAALLATLAACGKGSTASPCPTVKQLMRGSADALDQKEIEVVVATCRTDNWSAAVTKCLRESRTDSDDERCLKHLTDAQLSRLETALKPLEEEHALSNVKRKQALDDGFTVDLDALKPQGLAARAPGCKLYLDAIATARKASLDCTGPDDELEIFGLQQSVLAKLKELNAITDNAQLDLGCTTGAVDLAQTLKAICEPAPPR